MRHQDPANQPDPKDWMSKFRWSNFPIPEGHLIPLIAGITLHFFIPRKFSRSPTLKHKLGLPLILLGALLTTWSVMTIKDIEISRPNRIIVSGPYRFSRNPMYLGWTLIYTGITVLVNTRWALYFLPWSLIFTHYFVILKEERQLEQEFDEEYRKYRDRVRRYL